MQCEPDQALLQDRKSNRRLTRRFRFHDQRHTFASTLANKGINRVTLRDILGHTSTRTTENTATQRRNTRRRDPRARLEALQYS